MRIDFLGIASCLCLALFAMPARAQDADEAAEEQQEAEAPPVEDAGRDDQARALFQAGRVAFDNGRYDEAMTHFQSAYDLSHRPAILYNIGHTAQLISDDRRALAAYEQYLIESPEAENRTAVESRVQALRQNIADEDARTEAANRESATREAEDQSNMPAPPPPPAEGGTPIGGWLLFGAGVAVAVGGIVSLVLARGSASNVTDVPAGTAWTVVEGDYDSAGVLSIVGGLLIGVGAAAAIGGLTWVIVGGSSTAEVAIVPGGVSIRGTL